MSSGKANGNGRNALDNHRGACLRCRMTVAPGDRNAQKRGDGWIHQDCIAYYDREQNGQSAPLVIVKAPVRPKARSPKDLVAAFSRL